MKSSWFLLIGCLILALTDYTNCSPSEPYLDEDDGIISDDEYAENEIDSLMQSAQKRACIRRGGNCDHRPNDCCYNSSCRCNLWGSNCRCQRMGLFQKWG
ncbi:PREDICTED: uncharacterized protein LOC108565102 isoform X2 [Nicrophorus vespilloides]|uniref:Uncharacterized protein LOC108565102 isoform X2 n=1 Tax=Nicrophorus vespilloides TaxID=110193 RepID=A0ABM1MZ84_NICVS|nr:PREDICTED: uncharacterized protein LOC108565102 isoform X2 [Nicrophorus vespilloides]